MSAVELVTTFRFGLPVRNVRLVLWHGCMMVIWLSLHQKGIMMFSFHGFRSEICIILGGILPSIFWFLVVVWFGFLLQLISKRRLSSLSVGFIHLAKHEGATSMILYMQKSLYLSLQ